MPAPLAGPQAAFTFLGAEQLTFVPPCEARQVQFHGPAPVTVDAAPFAQSEAVGFVSEGTPFAGPQAPLVDLVAEQDAALPPFTPEQVQFQGPVPVTGEAVPTLQSPLAGWV